MFYFRKFESQGAVGLRPFNFAESSENNERCSAVVSQSGAKRCIGDFSSVNVKNTMESLRLVKPVFSRWDRKSVSQLVQHYQSCADLGSIEKYNKTQVSADLVDGRWRGLVTWDNVMVQGLSRSRSMDFLPQKDVSGTRALCALFESKSSMQRSTSVQRLNTPPEGTLDDWENDNRNINNQRQKGLEGVTGRALNGQPESHNRGVGYFKDYINSIPVTKRSQIQGRNRIPTSSSLRDRSALYLSRADATRGSVQPESISTTQGKKPKNNKMDLADGSVTVSHTPCDEYDLPPPPPPPPVPPRPLDYDGPSAGGLPPPPPKETFSTFYQQRQKSELKRLFKHIHPDLRASLDDVSEEDLMKAVQTEIPSAAEVSYQGEVQSMRWIFENWTLDNIGDPHETKKLLDEENLKGGNVQGTTSVFEQTDLSQPTHAQRQTSVCGDVRTSTWLFETQPLDSLSKSKEGGELVEALLKEPIQPGDVKSTRHLFESTSLGDLGRCNSVDNSFLKLKSELQEQKGDVQTTVKLFQADPDCAIRDKSGNIHKIKSICREEINTSDITTARWLFETQPLDLINKGSEKVKIIRGISLEEGQKGGVGKKRWMFETQPFETIHEMMGGHKFEGTVVDCVADADVVNKTKLFETNSLSALRGDTAEKTLEKEEIVGGDVKSSLWLFETQPMETLNDNYEVGRLQKISLSAEEQGEVKDKKQMFESCSAETNIMTKEQEVEKGDVKTFKHLFETIPISKISHCDDCDEKNKTTNEAGNVQENRQLFEKNYAIKDCSGNLHKVTAISREEFIKGKVQNYKWMFETKSLDELAERKGSIEVIKGITRQEDTMGDVKTAHWLFETQTIDVIHSKFNQPNPSTDEEQHKGDVKTCKWLFETQPMDILYDKTQKATDKEAINSTDVKSITWLFESQPLDSFKGGEEYSLKLCSTIKNPVKPEVGIQTVKHLFETETLDRIQKDAHLEDLRCVSQVNLQSGDVSRVKELFESQSLEEIGLVMTTSNTQTQDKLIEEGSVHKFTWLFDNCPMNKINMENNDEFTQKVTEVECGDVKNKKFIFETSSLDKIHEEDLEQKSLCVEKPTSSIDVKSSTMMFESTPLYAIRDKEGQFHEVTTVKKEEVMSGDVRGARWMFETKPLDAIKAENEVYVIRAVTQEDMEKGDVKSARWKFETQPLDTLTNKDAPATKVLEDLGSGSVQQNKQIFECDQTSKKVVRMVSVTDVQRGDVRTSTWLFENQSIDSLKGEPQEQGPVNTVHREDSQKGDVKRCTWLFESQPLDKIKEQEGLSAQSTVEAIPKSDVKCTTWLFETTPIDKITATSVVDSLSYLHELNFVHSGGIIIEGKDNQNVNMAKYCMESNRNVQIQKEEAVGGNIRNIMLQLLTKPTLKPQVTLLKEVEKGKVKTTVLELPVYQCSLVGLEKDQRIQNIVQRIEEVLDLDKTFKKGIIMQETEEGQAEMSVYSLMCHCEAKTENVAIEKGDVKSTIGNLLATSNSLKTASSYKVDENEKGNVNLYKRCIEEGDLKSLHTENMEDEVDNICPSKDQIEIIQGDVKEAKRSLCQQKEQVERTISDVLPGDVKNTKKMFSSECSLNVETCIPKDEIIPGDVLTAKQQLAVKQTKLVEKEEIVAGDIKATMQSLERAKQQSMTIEREMIKPGTIYDMDLSVPDLEENKQTQKEVIISGDVKAAKKSLEMAKQQSMHVEREVVVPGKIYNLNLSAQEETSTITSSSSSSSSTSRYQQIKTYPKVSDLVKQREMNASFEPSVVVCNGVPESLPTYECNGQANDDVTGEVIRGDIKAAIRSLQSAVSEQKPTDKEDIVKGNVQMALRSLERSSVNVSKGDYKAAMIYRNSGRSKAVTEQCVEMPLPPSDTKLSPSISVTHEEASTATSPTLVDKGNSQSSNFKNTASPPPQNTTEKLQHHKKPALPPKPQWARYVHVEDEKNNLTSSNIDCPIKDDVKIAVTPATYRHNETATVMDETSKCLTINAEITEKVSPPLEENFQSQNTGVELERNVIQKINAEEEIQMSIRTYSEDERHETNLSLRAALQNFERKDEKKGPTLCKKVKVTHSKDTDIFPKHKSTPDSVQKQDQTQVQTPGITAADLKQNGNNENQQDQVEKVVLREKKVRRETEEERRQRLSVHMDEIVKGNVEVALEIFDNLRKRDTLNQILSEVQEIEGDRNSEDHRSLKKIYNNYPDWAVTKSRNMKHDKTEDSLDDDLESISSVDTAYEDLEKASKEIMHLKEQTLAKLLDIEETIKKALYSVSNLKSEADITGLSGLFDESLKSEQHPQPANNIRKISIGSCKSKQGSIKESPSVLKQESPRQPQPRQSPSQSSPSFISIHSAARKGAEQPKSPMTPFTAKTDAPSQCCHKVHESSPSNSSKNTPQRKVSVLEVKTAPGQPPAGVFGTKTVSETYEETDGFGNMFLSSVTSTFVHKQSDNQSPAMFEVVGAPPRCEVGLTSPLMQKRHFEDQLMNKSKREGSVIVTFSPPMEKH